MPSTIREVCELSAGPRSASSTGLANDTGTYFCGGLSLHETWSMVGKAIRKMRGLVVAVLPLLLASNPSCPANITTEIELVDNWVAADASVFQVLSDTELIEEPEVIVNGDSGEFSYFHSDFYGDDYGVMMMSWEHVANVSVRPVTYEGNTSVDFICFTKSFDWPYEQVPERAYVAIDYILVVASAAVLLAATILIRRRRIGGTA